MNMIPLSALDRPVAFHPVFRRVSGSTVAAVFLSQAWYWTKRLPEDRDGWFFKNHEEWEEETGLSRKEQATARKALKDLGIMEEERRGIDPTLWFRVNAERLAELISEVESDKDTAMGDTEHAYAPKGTQAWAKSDTGMRQTVHTLHTENTPETTPPPEGGEDAGDDDDAAQHEERFERFWEHYPRKEGKKPCKTWWMRHKPDDALTDHMIAAVEAQSRSKKWTKDRMQYIPMPSTWLNQERWEDVVDGVPGTRIVTRKPEEMSEIERLRWEIEDENKHARIFGAPRLQFFREREARIRELEAEGGDA